MVNSKTLRTLKGMIIGYDENCNSILVFLSFFFLTHQLYARNEMHLSHLVSVFFLLTYPTEHIQA